MIFTTYKAAQYGFKVRIADREKYFSKKWKNIVLELPTKNVFSEAICNVAKASFWNESCHEVIKKEIALWLKDNGYDKWKKGKPYKFEVEHLKDNKFRLIGEAE